MSARSTTELHLVPKYKIKAYVQFYFSEDDKVCMKSQLILIENSPYQTNFTSNDLFCIYFNNCKYMEGMYSMEIMHFLICYCKSLAVGIRLLYSRSSGIGGEESVNRKLCLI